MTRRAFAVQPNELSRQRYALGLLFRTDRPVRTPPAGQAATDPGAVAVAFATVHADLTALANNLRAAGRDEPAQIVEATVLIASDPDLRGRVESGLKAGASAEEAIHGAVEFFAGVLESLPDPTLAGRAADVRSVGRRLVAALTDDARAVPTGGRLVLVAREVTADDLLVHADALAGAATVLGGATSHAGIVARSLGVPIVFGLDEDALESADGTEVLVDAREGMVVVVPDPGERREAMGEATVAEARRTELAAERGRPVSTRDGQAVAVVANVASTVDADLAIAMGARGVGLLRTEMHFLDAGTWPTYAEHVAQLEPVLRRLSGLPVTVRTLDFADDKLPPFLRAGRTGPLGRSLPLMLAEPEAFARQIRAILDVGGDLRIMIPMVASAEELDACRRLIASVGAGTPPVGAMIELPEAVADVDAIAARSDFLSIGTNDLTASVLGLSRRDPALTTARVLEPAVLGAVAATVRAGARHGIPVSVCGDAASEPAVLPALVGVGCRILSAAPSMLDEVRATIRALDATACADAVAATLHAAT